MGRLLRIVAVLLPLAGFVLAVLQVRRLMDDGQGLLSLGVLLVALVVLALVEGLLFKCWILPPIAGELGERVYAGGSYSPSGDALLVLVERIRETRDRNLLPQLEQLVLADARRTRGWQEYAHVLQEVFSDVPSALEVLRRGAACVRDKEDRAMLLCRAAYAAQRDSSLAREFYEEAARKYPKTVYGKLARGKLS